MKRPLRLENISARKDIRHRNHNDSRGAVKVHTFLDLPGNRPTLIHISHGKYHDSNVMDKAYVDLSVLYEMEQICAFFGTRAKQNIVFEVIETNYNIGELTGLVSDQTIILKGVKSVKLYPMPLRIVVFRDSEKGILLTFITNNFELSALDVAYIYKNRWQIEVFFKWVKQNLTIKRLWGHSENAVHIHIWVALSAYLLVVYIKEQFGSKLSIYEVMQILSTSAFDKTSIC